MEIITNVRGFLSKETFDKFVGISIFGNSYTKVKKVINYKRGRVQ